MAYNSTIVDINPVEFDPFAPQEQIHPVLTNSTVSDDGLIEYITVPVEFDPFAGPEIVAIAPITEPQAEIWASCLIGGNEANCAYNESFSLLLTGHLNKNALLRALSDIVQLHEALRTTFSADGLNICILKEILLDVDYKDISTQTDSEQANFISDYNKQAAVTPFNLIIGPLFKASLFKLADDKYLLTLIAHHIICDGWSIGIIMQDLGSLYSAYAQNRPLPALIAPSFGNYAKEQPGLMQAKEYLQTEKYWLKQFEGSDYLLNLPVDYPRPRVRTYKSQRLDLILNGDLTNKVKHLGKTAGSGFVTTLMAAFELFLWQLTGHDEIILGLPAAGQAATENFRLVGHCVNLLALRSFPKGDISFKTYLNHADRQANSIAATGSTLNLPPLRVSPSWLRGSGLVSVVRLHNFPAGQHSRDGPHPESFCKYRLRVGRCGRLPQGGPLSCKLSPSC